MSHEIRTGDLGGYLTRILTERNLTLDQLATRADIPAETLLDWLTRRAVDPDQLRRAADALGVPVVDMFQAAGRYTPGPLTPEQEHKLRELFRELEDD